MDSAHHILLLEGDEQSAQDIQRFLKVSAYAFSISHASTVQEGLQYMRNRKPDVILLDADMAKLREYGSFKQSLSQARIPVILLSDLSPVESRAVAEQAGATDYLVKNKINLFHLQKAILNTLKVNEAEAKLNQSTNQFQQQQNALLKVLQKINSGVLVINAQNNILYANARAYNILAEEQLRGQLVNYLKFRKVESEELIEFRPGKNIQISIKVSESDWNGETVNLFIVDRTRVEEPKELNLLSNEALITFLNLVNEKILLLKDGAVFFANKAAQVQLGAKASGLLQKSLFDIFEVNDYQAGGNSINDFLKERKFSGSYTGANGSGEELSFYLKPINVADDFYELLSFEVIPQAATSQPGQREDEDKFSTQGILHLASHDLREPVRTILNYVQLISDNLNKKNYTAASEYADFARSAADRMEKLLSDLKVYVALNDYKFSVAKTSIKLVAADVLKQLKGRIDASGAEINIADLPDVKADRDLAEKLIYHLVDNALKFHKPGKKPVIDIGYDKFEGNVLFCVRDNGIGISKKYQTKIFDLFERLNRVDEYPGNGLGLAICKKIIDIHGGKIWVESLPGFGSSFYFTFSGQ